MTKLEICCMADLRELYFNILKCIRKGLQVNLEIKSTRELRTLSQLGYYWAVIIPTIQAYFRDSGQKMSQTEVHYFLKLEFYYEEIISPITDRVIREPKSLVGISIDRMSEFINDIIIWAAGIGLDIPVCDKQEEVK